MSIFELLVMFVLSYKTRVDPLLACSLAFVQRIPQIHLWCYTCWPLDGQHGSGAFLTHVLVHVQTSIGWALTVWAIPARLSPLRIVSCAWNQCSSILHYFVSEILDPHLHFKDSHRDPPSEAEGEAICNFVKFTKEPLEIGKILVSQGQGRPMDMIWDDLTRSRAFVDPAFLCLFTGGYLGGGVQCLNRQSTLNAGTKCKRNARRKGRKLTTFSRKKWCLRKVGSATSAKVPLFQRKDKWTEGKNIKRSGLCPDSGRQGKLLSEFDSVCFQIFLSPYLSAWYVSENLFASFIPFVTLYSFDSVGVSWNFILNHNEHRIWQFL